MVVTAWSFTYAQEVSEPEFVGEVLMLSPDGTVQPLEKSTILQRTRANASAMIVGIGKVKTKIIIDGPAASVRIPADGEHKLIVRAIDNNTDPMRIISVFSFNVSKKNRQAEFASVSTFGSVKNNKLKYLPFTAKKYGNSSYLLTLSEMPEGEYGIIVRNPNSLDESAVIVASFAIDASAAQFPSAE